jgi:hypothetical protein
MENISKERLELLIDEVKDLEGSVLLDVTNEKASVMREACATMPVYDNESMAKREFFRGVVNGLEWFTKDIHEFIKQSDELLQKNKK